jgi:hypothetical protein
MEITMENHRRPRSRSTDFATRKEAAGGLAIAALGFIAADAERLGSFLALTGIGPDSLRMAARDSNFLLGVLDHIAGDEALLIAFAEHTEIDPADVGRARDVLAGAPPELP